MEPSSDATQASLPVGRSARLEALALTAAGDHAVLVMLGIDRMFVGLGCRQRLRVAGAFDHLALDTVAVAAAAGIAVARAAAMAAVLVLFLGLAMGALVGPVMRETKGKADGGEVNRLIREQLGV